MGKIYTLLSIHMLLLSLYSMAYFDNHVLAVIAAIHIL